ncbi:MAG: SpoIIIAH-like family protein [Oscillospiraceae bacterium]|nr:SpoIIIAH-like family protein [Oscillospiraceae bacterium]
MKNLLGKRQVMMAVLVTALGLAVYLNYFFTAGPPDAEPAGNDTVPQQTTASTTRNNLGDSQFVNNTTIAITQQTTAAVTYFSQARINRSTARQEALDILKDTLNNVKSTDAMKTQAAAATIEITKAIERENNIENLLKAKGFQDSVVYIEGKNCHVVVLADGLKPQETIQITEIITAQSQIKAGDIVIIPVNN